MVMRPCKLCKKLGLYPVSERLKVEQRHEQILLDFRSVAVKSITRNVQTYSGGNCLAHLSKLPWIAYQLSSVTQSYPTLCDPLDSSKPGFHVRQLLELTHS